MSRSGEMFRPWRTISSPVLTMMVKKLGSIISQRPRRSFEAPTPPASAVIFSFGFEGMKSSDAGGVGSATREAIGTGNFRDAIAERRREKFVAMDEFGIDGEAFAQGEAAGLGFGLQARDLGPGGLGIDEIFGDRRNAAPIVDACFEQERKIAVAQVRRGLDVHVRPKNKAGDSNRAQHVFEGWLRVSGHGNFRLGTKILDDHFLDVAVFFVERSNGQKGVDALVHGFAYTDQDAGRERDTEFAGFFDSAKTKRGHFVRSFGMRQAVTHEARADVVEHEADAGVGILQALEGSMIHEAGIGVRKQAGFFEDEFAHGREIVERTGVALRA